MGKILGLVGGVVTTIWVGLLAAYAVFKWETIVDLEPNEAGDLLGGSMGPLALFWLVLGYLQQGIELRQNGAALSLQAEELKHAVDQYKEMARVANEQLVHDKEAAKRAAEGELEIRKREKAAMQPNFNFAGAGGTHSNVSDHRVSIANSGGPANEVMLHFDDGTKLNPFKVDYWARETHIQIQFETPRSPTIEGKELTISYRDADGDATSIIYRVDFVDGGTGHCTPAFRKKLR